MMYRVGSLLSRSLDSFQGISVVDFGVEMNVVTSVTSPSVFRGHSLYCSKTGKFFFFSLSLDQHRWFYEGPPSTDWKIDYTVNHFINDRYYHVIVGRAPWWIGTDKIESWSFKGDGVPRVVLLWWQQLSSPDYVVCLQFTKEIYPF